MGTEKINYCEEITFTLITAYFFPFFSLFRKCKNISSLQDIRPSANQQRAKEFGGHLVQRVTCDASKDAFLLSLSINGIITMKCLVFIGVIFALAANGELPYEICAKIFQPFVQFRSKI